MKIFVGMTFKTDEEYKEFLNQIQKDCEAGKPYPDYKITTYSNGVRVLSDLVYHTGRY